MTKPDLRWAKRSDLELFYGKPQGVTMRGYVVYLDGKPVAVGGVSYQCGVLCAFADVKDELRPYKVSIMKFARKVGGLFHGMPGMAIASPNEPNSGKLLEWLGFKYVTTCADGEVYEWRN